MQSILKYLMVPIQYNSNALINTVSQKWNNGPQRSHHVETWLQQSISCLQTV
jgi:hypothetical protein